jgi:DNA-binding response OmpR family regulator
MPETVIVVGDTEVAASEETRILAASGYGVLLGRTINAADLIEQYRTASAVILCFTCTEMSQALNLLEHTAANANQPLLVVADRAYLEIDVLRAGADVWLPRPYAAELFTARVAALVRAYRRWSPKRRLALNPHAGELVAGSTIVRFSATEAELLAVLVREAPSPVPRARLAEVCRVRSHKSQALTQHMSRLRQKLRNTGSTYIIGTRGGYSLVTDENIDIGNTAIQRRDLR